MRILLLAVPAIALVSACAPVAAPQLGPDGKPMPVVYRISAAQEGRIQQRALDSVNALRQATGAPLLALDPALNAAAALHARDMSVQNRPWHFGSDGSSPIDRVQRAGYPGAFRGETISETYETEFETIGAWIEDPETRPVLLDTAARHMGFSFYQEPTGKIWWTLVTGG